MPKVSVIIPTYNRAHILPRTISSVLNQTFKDFELIVVDDCSTDNTKEIVGGFQREDKRIRYIRLDKNSGGPACPKNVGIQNSCGEFIAFLDDDDEWLPKKLEKQLKLFVKDSREKRIGLVTCNVFIIEDSKKRLYRLPKYKNNFLELLKRNFILTCSSVVVKKDVLDKVGFFDENLTFADDWDLWLRILKRYKFSFIPEFLVKYHLHGENRMRKLHFQEKIKEIEYLLNKHKQIYQKFPEAESAAKRKIASYYFLLGDVKTGRKYYWISIKLNPKSPTNYFYFLLSLLGVRIFRKLYYIRKNHWYFFSLLFRIFKRY